MACCNQCCSRRPVNREPIWAAGAGAVDEPGTGESIATTDGDLVPGLYRVAVELWCYDGALTEVTADFFGLYCGEEWVMTLAAPMDGVSRREIPYRVKAGTSLSVRCYANMAAVSFAATITAERIGE